MYLPRVSPIRLRRHAVSFQKPYSRLNPVEERVPVDLSFNVLNSGVTDASDGPLVILHGLFGSKRNWNSLCKAFHRELPGRAVYSLDLRNHGASPRAKPHTYQSMSEDVQHFLTTHGLKNVSLLGHSMGGKVAMTVALAQSDRVSQLVVADMAPVLAKLAPKLHQNISMMQDINAMPRGMVKSFAEADRIMSAYEDDVVVRQFLLTNFVVPSHARTANPNEKAHFKVPLDIIKHSMQALSEFPYDFRQQGHPVFDKPVLVVAGAHSEYQILDHVEAFNAFFPQASFETLDAGHWVHAERPNEFKTLVVDFLRRNS